MKWENELRSWMGGREEWDLTVHQGMDRWSDSKNRERRDEKHKREREMWFRGPSFSFLFMHLVFQVSFSQSASKRESEKSWKTRNTQVPHPESTFIPNFICSFSSLTLHPVVCRLFTRFTIDYTIQISICITRFPALFAPASHARRRS